MEGNYALLFQTHVKGLHAGSNGQAIAHCPWHDDRKASFSVNLESGLWKCFAGCGEGNAYQFAKMVGIDPKPYISKATVPRPTSVKIDKELNEEDIKRYREFYKYLMKHFDELCRELPWSLKAVEKTYTGYDPESKRFTFLHTNSEDKAVNIKWHKKGHDSPYSIKDHGNCRLYPLHLINLYPKDKELILVEGEKDVVTLLSQGFNAATVSTTGGGSIAGDLKPFKNFKNIYTCYDNDKTGIEGGEKTAKRLKREFPQMTVLLHQWELAERKGFDVTDFFQRGRTPDDFNKRLAEAVEFKPEHEISPGEIERKRTNKGSLIFNPVIEAEIFLLNHKIIFHHEQLKEYLNGYYKTLPDRYFLNLITQQLKPFNSRQYKAREVLETLKNGLTDPDIDEKVNPDPYVLNMKNGLLDIREMELKPHNPNYLSTFRINARYKPDASCKRFMEFLDEIFVDDNYEPDNEVINVIQEFVGYCLLAKILIHKAAIFYGDGNNGKSVLVYVLEKLFVDHISNVHFESIGRDVFATSDIAESLLNISSEISANAQLKDGTIKQIISGDMIRAQRKNQPAFDFRPVSKHIITANNLPRSTDKSFAFFRRFMVIPFNQTFLTQKEINIQPEEIKKYYKVEETNLEETLYNELDGILLWALKGLKRLLKNKSFSNSSQIDALNKVFKIRSTTVETFIKEKVDQSDVTINTELQNVFLGYVEYCKNYHIPPLSNRRFATELRNQGFLVEKSTGGKTFVRGCEIISKDNNNNELPF